MSKSQKRTRALILAALIRPSFIVSLALKGERAQGMPGEGLTHGPRAIKKHGEGTTGAAGSSGGFKRSSQHWFFSLVTATRQALRPGSSSPASFEVGH